MLKKLIDAICFKLTCDALHGQSSPRFEISRLDLKPGDRLVVRFKERLPKDTVDRLKSSMEGVLPKDVKIMIFEGAPDLSVISCDRIAA